MKTGWTLEYIEHLDDFQVRFCFRMMALDNAMKRTQASLMGVEGIKPQDVENAVRAVVNEMLEDWERADAGWAQALEAFDHARDDSRNGLRREGERAQLPGESAEAAG